MRLSSSNLGKPLLTLAAGVGVSAWFLFVFCNYLLDSSSAVLPILQFTPLESFLRMGIVDLLLVFWIWAVAAAAGARLLKLFGLEPGNNPEWLALSSAGGLSILALTVMVLGGLKLLYPWVAYTILVMTSIGLWPQWKSAFREIGLPQRARSSPVASLGRGLVWLLIGAVLLLILISALGPEIEWDALVVHLFAAKTYVQGHGLKPIPDVPQTFFPRHVTMLFTFAMLLHNETTAKLVQYLLGILTLIAAYGFGCRVFSRDVALVSVAILMSSPLFVWEMRTAHTELGLTLYVFLSLMAAVVWLRSRERGWLIASTYFLAFSQGTKYHALFALFALACIVAVEHWSQARDVKRAIYTGGRIAALGALGLVPWVLDNAIRAGNPFFPFFNTVFASPYWDASLTRIGMHEMQNSGVSLSLQNWWQLLTLGWQMVTNDNANFHGNLGPFYLILLPLLSFSRRPIREIWLILGFSFVYGLFWLVTGQHARYVLPLLPALALVSASALMGWMEWCISRRQRWIAFASALVLLLVASLASPFFENLHGGSRYGSQILPSLPWSVLSGKETKEVYLTRQMPSFPLVQHLNQLPGAEKNSVLVEHESLCVLCRCRSRLQLFSLLPEVVVRPGAGASIDSFKISSNASSRGPGGPRGISADRSRTKIYPKTPPSSDAEERSHPLRILERGSETGKSGL